ncbi:unnamed protein product [marine sediment metagenome]|uniref:Uncharacterized protein n=1 Tax=marine sediment metagenome TaxID=412755 RepID=X0U0Y4_9ZZZZ
MRPRCIKVSAAYVMNAFKVTSIKGDADEFEDLLEGEVFAAADEMYELARQGVYKVTPWLGDIPGWVATYVPGNRFVRACKAFVCILLGL